MRSERLKNGHCLSDDTFYYARLIFTHFILLPLDKLFRLWHTIYMKVWSVKEAAKELGISERRVRKLLEEGRIKGKKLSGVWVVFEPSYTKKRGR